MSISNDDPVLVMHQPKGKITVESCRTKRTTQQLHTTTTHRARLHSTTHIARICATHTTYTAAMQRNATSIPVWPMSSLHGRDRHTPMGACQIVVATVDYV